MEYIILSIICLATLIVIAIVLNINIQHIKKVGKNTQLDELCTEFPSNIEICKEILKKLKNKTTKIKEDLGAKASFYFVMNDTISIANIQNSFTRIQTVAHECLHSVQNRRILKFNYIYSNIYLLSYIVFIGLTIFRVIKDKMMIISIIIIMSFIYYIIRSFLEIDAMTKARYVAKEFLEENNITTKENIEKIVEQYDILNELGIKTVCYSLFMSVMIKIILYCIICSVISFI